MRISVLTLFPPMFLPLEYSIIGRARERGVLDIEIVDIRDYSDDKHRKCDDTPFGGGAGMVMTPQPIAAALKAVDGERKARRIFLSPGGRTFNQAAAKRLSASYKHIVLLCGHYEGIDQRIIDHYMDEQISVGDFVLSGGEIAALTVIDAVGRLVDGVLGSPESLKEESFSDGESVEYPQYTRPQNFDGYEVPPVLLSGNHKDIADWRRNMSERLTAERKAKADKE